MSLLIDILRHNIDLDGKFNMIIPLVILLIGLLQKFVWIMSRNISIIFCSNSSNEYFNNPTINMIENNVKCIATDISLHTSKNLLTFINQRNRCCFEYHIYEFCHR